MSSRLDLIEKADSGINRIRNSIKKKGLKIKFEVDDFFKIIFSRLGDEETVEKTIQKTTQKIIELIKENPSITREELAKILNLSSDGVKYHLTNLRKKKVLERIGGKKGGYWKIVERSGR